MIAQIRADLRWNRKRRQSFKICFRVTFKHVTLNFHSNCFRIVKFVRSACIVLMYIVTFRYAFHLNQLGRAVEWYVTKLEQKCTDSVNLVTNIRIIQKVLSLPSWEMAERTKKKTRIYLEKSIYSICEFGSPFIVCHLRNVRHFAEQLTHC